MTKTNAHAAHAGLPRLSQRLRMSYEPGSSRWTLRHSDAVVQLNDSAAQILRRCDGRHTVSDIVGELESLFDTRGIAPDVQSLIEEGVRRGWLE